MSNDTKSRILDLAEQLSRRRGFHGFSYRDIAEPLEIRNAAVHYHFPTKADLGVALIRRYRELLHRRTRRFMAQGGDPRPQLEGLFGVYVKDTLNQTICPIGMVSVEYYTLPEEMRREGALLVEETLTWLTRVLETGREQALLRFEGPARSRAVEVLAALQGATQIERLSEEGPLGTAMTEIRRDLGLEETSSSPA